MTVNFIFENRVRKIPNHLQGNDRPLTRVSGEDFKLRPVVA